VSTESEAGQHEEVQEIRVALDPLLVAAYRLGGDDADVVTVDLTGAEDHLHEEDRQALDSLPTDLGNRIVFGQLQETNRVRVSTTMDHDSGALPRDEGSAAVGNRELLAHYDTILADKYVSWVSEFRFKRRLGAGGQGVVYLTETRGHDDFAFPVALKVFSPERFRDARDYEETMHRNAHVAARVAQIHHENLLDVHKFVHRDRIRMMIMEFIDGYDLRRLLVSSLLAGVKGRVSNRRWEYINRVIITDGPEQPRLKAGVAVDIIRDCLSALAELHRADIVHGDIKPSNIMLKRTGTAKIIDMGSAFEWNVLPRQLNFTLAYAAPEVIEHRVCTPQSDLASLGYVLVELLSGRALFAGATDERHLLEVKRSLPRRLDEIFPDEVRRSDVLMTFCRRLIAPDPTRRFASAEEADLQPNEGASAFHFQLVRGNLASVFHNDLRIWIEAVKEWDETRGMLTEGRE
jgi:serine/threonine-protein kinase